MFYMYLKIEDGIRITGHESWTFIFWKVKKDKECMICSHFSLCEQILVEGMLVVSLLWFLSQCESVFSLCNSVFAY